MADRKPGNTERFTEISTEHLPAEIQELEKRLQADYTRKMQSIADERKQFEEYKSQAEEQLTKFNEQLVATNEYVTALEDTNQRWVAYDKARQEKDAEEKAAMAAGKGKPRTSETESEDDDEDNIMNNPQLKQALDRINQYDETLASLNERTAKLDKKLSYSHQLNDLYRSVGKEYEIDPDRILKRAAELKTDDLTVAFKNEYYDEIREREVQARVEEEKKALEEKYRGEALAPSEGNTQERAFYVRPEGAFHDYAEASEAASRDIRLAELDASKGAPL